VRGTRLLPTGGRTSRIGFLRNCEPVASAGTGNGDFVMKKLILAVVMALGVGVGMSSAFAATAGSTSNRPQVVHNGADWGNDSGSMD
jgi:hypothetical protein